MPFADEMEKAVSKAVRLAYPEIAESARTRRARAACGEACLFLAIEGPPRGRQACEPVPRAPVVEPGLLIAALLCQYRFAAT